MTLKYDIPEYEGELYSGSFTELRVKKKDERLDSYVKCLVCGAKLKQVEKNHLAKHGLTIEEYKGRFPDADLISRDYLEELRERYRKTIGIKRNKVCLDCSKPFVTYSPNKVRCDACQRKYRLEALRKRERIRRRSFKPLNQILGSGDKSTHLTILPNGRVSGAVWLENEMKKLNGRKRRYKCPVCEEDDMLLVINHQPYCIECKNKIVYARENKYYSLSEFVCSSCGLVLEPYAFTC
ncbi:MAG: MucR family transcriptional regulator [Fervidobacterium sp.]